MEPTDIVNAIDEVISEGSRWEYCTLKDLVRDVCGLRREYEKTIENLRQEIRELQDNLSGME